MGSERTALLILGGVPLSGKPSFRGSREKGREERFVAGNKFKKVSRSREGSNYPTSPAADEYGFENG